MTREDCTIFEEFEMATASTTKEHLLERAGTPYSIEREIDLNRKTRTAFSLDLVEDNDEGAIGSRVAEASRVLSPGKWTVVNERHPKPRRDGHRSLPSLT